jgi:hypothetical protein
MAFMETLTNINSIASTRPIAPTEEVDIDKAVAAIIDVEDHEAIAEALATVEEAPIEDLVEMDSEMEPDINKRSTISIIK